MKIFNISYTDTGGAGIAVRRTHDRLLKLGYDSVLLLHNEVKHQSIVKNVNFINRFKSLIYKLIYKPLKFDDKYSFFSIFELKEINVDNIIAKVNDGDIIILYWLGGGTLNVKSISKIAKAKKVKIFWYALDMSPITGGCHYYWDCISYKTNCLKCPAIISSNNDFASKQFTQKSETLKSIKIELLASSTIGIEKLKKGYLKFNSYQVMPYAIDTNVFTIKNSNKNNNEFNLFFNAQNTNDLRKGFLYLLKILERLDVLLNDTSIKLNLISVNIKEHKLYFDKLNNIKIIHSIQPPSNSENELATLYQMSDIFLCTSVEDLSPLMVNEAMLCGVPVIGFDNASNSEYITSGLNGVLVNNYSIEDYANAIFKIAIKKTLLASAESIRNSIISIHEENEWAITFKKILAS